MSLASAAPLAELSVSDDGISPGAVEKHSNIVVAMEYHLVQRKSKTRAKIILSQENSANKTINKLLCENKLTKRNSLVKMKKIIRF